MIVPITPGEAYQIWQWARERQGLKKPFTSKRVTWYKDDLSIHYDGIRGEYAVHKVLNLPYDPKPLPHGDKGEPDLILPTGESIEVKFRGKQGWQFALNSDDPTTFKADLGVLCWPVEGSDDVEIAGWFTRRDFQDHFEIVNFTKRKGGERAAYPNEKLATMEFLLFLVHFKNWLVTGRGEAMHEPVPVCVGH